MSPLAGGSPNGSDSGSSPWPDASSTPAGEDDYAFPRTGPGTSSSTPAGPRSAPPDGKDPDPTTRTGEPAATASGNTHVLAPTTISTPVVTPISATHERSRLVVGQGGS